MYWSEDTEPFKRAKEGKKQEYIKKFTQINQSYNLTLTQKEIEDNADKIAYEEIKSRGTFAKNFWEGFFKVFLAIAAVTIAAVTAIFCPACSALMINLAWISLGVSAVGAVATLTIDALGSLAAAQLEWKGVEMKNLLTFGALQSSTREAKAQEQITNLLIYNPYEMCATRSIYTAQAPGGESFSPQIAYDANKGFLGQYEKNQLDEKIMRRESSELAGGRDFAAKMHGELGIPIKQFNENKELVQENHTRAYTRARTRIYEGFEKLVEAKFGHAYDVYKKDDIYDDDSPSSALEVRIKEIYTQQTYKYKNAIIQNRFLDSTRAYSKGKKGDFNYIHLSDFMPPTKDQRRKAAKAFLEKLQSDLKKLQDDPLFVAEQYFYYAQNMLSFFADFAVAQVACEGYAMSWTNITDKYYQPIGFYNGGMRYSANKIYGLCGAIERYGNKFTASSPPYQYEAQEGLTFYLDYFKIPALKYVGGINNFAQSRFQLFESGWGMGADGWAIEGLGMTFSVNYNLNCTYLRDFCGGFLDKPYEVSEAKELYDLTNKKPTEWIYEYERLLRTLCKCWIIGTETKAVEYIYGLGSKGYKEQVTKKNYYDSTALWVLAAIAGNNKDRTFNNRLIRYSLQAEYMKLFEEDKAALESNTLRPEKIRDFDLTLLDKHLGFE